MYKMEVTVLTHNWPRLQIIVSIPGNRVLEETCFYDIASSQFESKVGNGLRLMINDILKQYDPKFKPAS